MRKILLVAALFLSACHEMPKPSYYTPPGVPASEYKAMYESCIKKNAAGLDDGVSPANVIGRSIADVCNKEYVAYTMQSVSGDNDAVRNAFYHRITNDREFAATGPTQYILSRRAYLNKH